MPKRMWSRAHCTTTNTVEMVPWNRVVMSTVVRHQTVQDQGLTVQPSLLLTVGRISTGMVSRSRGLQLGNTHPFHNSCPTCACRDSNAVTTWGRSGSGGLLVGMGLGMVDTDIPGGIDSDT